MPSEFALPERIKLTQAGTVRAYFLRPILKVVMPKASALFSCRSRFQPIIGLVVLSLIFFSALSARAQAPTLIGTNNVLGFAKAKEVAMEGEGSVRLTAIRSSGLRGKLAVDVIVTSVSNAVVSATFTTNLVFND